MSALLPASVSMRAHFSPIRCSGQERECVGCEGGMRREGGREGESEYLDRVRME